MNRFGVDLTSNGGKANDDLISLKGSLIYWVNEEWELYYSAGQGFHSNDARGTTIRVDPISGAAVDQVDPLVRSTGHEVGVRGFINDTLNVSLALWSLNLDSELLFVGDAGNTEASRPTKRAGLELVAYYRFSDHLSTDFEYAYTDAKFSSPSPDGDNVPGAVRDVIQAGVNLDIDDSWFGSVRYRHFGKRPLIEDGSVESDSTSNWNLRIGYKRPKWRATLDLLNITDSTDNDIAYFYESRLNSEPSGTGTEDIHFHPLEPRNLRLTIELEW